MVKKYFYYSFIGMVFVTSFSAFITACTKAYTLSPLSSAAPTSTFTPTATSIPLIQQWSATYPEGVAVSSLGNVFVTSDNPSTDCYKFSSTGSFVSLVPSGDIEVAADSLGNIYYGDVTKMTDGLVYETSWTHTSLTALATDSTGNFYCLNVGTPFVQEYSGTGTLIRSWGLVVGSATGALNTPTAIAVDASGNVLIADWNNYRIVEFTNAGAYITEWGSAGTGPNQFRGPEGIAITPAGYIYVTDSNNNNVQKFTSSGTYVSTWTTSGPSMDVAEGIASDSSGNLYIADWGNNRILKVAF